MTRDELLARIATAKAATPGPWKCTELGNIWHGENVWLAGTGGGKADAAHIAANGPDAVVALCEELLALRARVEAIASELVPQPLSPAEELRAHNRAVIAKWAKCCDLASRGHRDGCPGRLEESDETLP